LRRKGRTNCGGPAPAERRFAAQRINGMLRRIRMGECLIRALTVLGSRRVCAGMMIDGGERGPNSKLNASRGGTG